MRTFGDTFIHPLLASPGPGRMAVSSLVLIELAVRR